MKAVADAKKAGKTVIKIGKDYFAESTATDAKTPGTRAYQLAARADEESNGREYITSPAALTKAKAEGRAVFKRGNDWFAVSAKEQAALNKKLTSNPSTSPNGTKITQEDKNDYNGSLLGLGGVVVTSGNPGQGQYTREQAARIIAQQFPWKSIKDIQKDIYDTYGDSYKSGTTSQAPSQSIDNLLKGYL